MKINGLNSFNINNKKNKQPKKMVFKGALRPDASEIKACMDLFKEQIKLFPKDNEYRKSIAKFFGLSKGDEYLLRPIIGIEEFTNAVKSFINKNFIPGNQKSLKFPDDRGLSFVNSGDFRANLHCHTNHSNDGVSKIKDVLSQAANMGNLNVS